MIKFLLILLLVATQILAGIGGSQYLCIDTDGRYCCIHPGPASCTCCQHEVPQDGENKHHHDGDGCCGAGTPEAIPGRHADPGRHDQQQVAAVDPCNCTHLLLLVSADKPFWNGRMSPEIGSDQFTHLANCRLAVAAELAAEGDLRPQGTSAPAESERTLALLATVVLRC